MENGLIGGEFVKQSNPAYITTRNRIFDELYEKYIKSIESNHNYFF